MSRTRERALLPKWSSPTLTFAHARRHGPRGLRLMMNTTKPWLRDDFQFSLCLLAAVARVLVPRRGSQLQR